MTGGARVLIVDDSPTVRRVVRRTLEGAGFDPLEAKDGREGLEQAQRHTPDLVLTDQFMPGMDGIALCKALRGVKNLAHVPVVLMSAKAETIAESFLRETGALDAIAKPFGPEALLAVTVHALERARDSTRALALARPPTRDTLEEPTAPDADGDAAQRAAGRLGEALRPILAALGDRAAEHADAELTQAILDAVGPSGLSTLANDLAELLSSEGGVSFRGRVEHVSLGEILQMLHHQRQTGVLEVRRGERSVAICMREGLLDLALGRGSDEELRLGRYLLDEELIERDELETLLRSRPSGRHLLGAQLVKLGYISADDLRQALVRQSSELIYEALRWQRGAFDFDRFATRPEAADARLGLPIAAILMEGLRRVDEWRLIEEQIRSFDVVPMLRLDALASIDAGGMSREERAVVDAIDGERTIRDIVHDTKLSSFDTCKVLFRLFASGLVVERTRGS